MERVWLPSEYLVSTVTHLLPLFFIYQLSPNFGTRIRAFGYDPPEAEGTCLIPRPFFPSPINHTSRGFNLSRNRHPVSLSLPDKVSLNVAASRTGLHATSLILPREKHARDVLRSPRASLPSARDYTCSGTSTKRAARTSISGPVQTGSARKIPLKQT